MTDRTQEERKTVRAWITDGSHSDIRRQGTYLRETEKTDGWQERMRGMIAALPAARHDGQIRLCEIERCTVVATRVIPMAAQEGA